MMFSRAMKLVKLKKAIAVFDKILCDKARLTRALK